MQKICIISSSRADYGIMSNLISKIQKDKNFKLDLIITGSHLSKKYGYTSDEIIQDRIKITHKIRISKTEYSTNISYLIGKFSKIFKKTKPKVIVLLGDRYEIFAAALSAYLLKIPISHLHGGEITKGSMDDGFRHSITKFSYLHFVATKNAYKRVLQLGEENSNVFNVGSLSLENINKIKLLNKVQIEKKYKVKLKKKVALVVFHPNTLQNNYNNISEINIILKKLKSFKDYSFIFSGSNIDIGGYEITKKVQSFCKKNNYLFKNSFGKIDFLSILKVSNIIIGNSSSAIIEAPFLKTFSINIGRRQAGREFAKSIFNCKFDGQEFFKLFQKINKINNKKKYFTTIPYKSKNGSDKIISILKNPIKHNFNFKNFTDI